MVDGGEGGEPFVAQSLLFQLLENFFLFFHVFFDLGHRIHDQQGDKNKYKEHKIAVRAEIRIQLPGENG